PFLGVLDAARKPIEPGAADLAVGTDHHAPHLRGRVFTPPCDVFGKPEKAQVPFHLRLVTQSDEGRKWFSRWLAKSSDIDCRARPALPADVTSAGRVRTRSRAWCRTKRRPTAQVAPAWRGSARRPRRSAAGLTESFDTATSHRIAIPIGPHSWRRS